MQEEYTEQNKSPETDPEPAVSDPSESTDLIESDPLESTDLVESDPAESAPLTPAEAKSQRRRERLQKLQNFLQDENVRELGRIIGASAVQIGGPIAYSRLFSRFERPDYAVTPGLRCYERVSERLPRECFTFPSDNVECAGYFYPAEHSRGLVAFAHGLHTGADDYLSIFEFLLKNGYSVIAFDGKGTYDSAGDSTVGLCEALVELDHLLNCIREDPTLREQPLYVLGHSCGGFAASAVLSLHPEIRASAVMSAMKDANTMIVGKGFLYSSILGIPETPLTAAFLEETQHKLFGSYTELNGVRAVNESSCPVLIAHGVRDLVVDYLSDLALISHRKELRTENVFYYTGTGACGAHDTVWRAAEAVRYQEQVKKDLEVLKRKKGKTFSREDEISFVSGLDHALYSAVNEELFSLVIETFEKA